MALRLVPRPSTDADGTSGAYRLFVPTGNGSYDSTNDYSETVLELNVASNGALSLGGSFTSSNQAALTAADLDVGSAGTLVLPDTLPSGVGGSISHLAVQATKSGELFLLNRDSLGGYAGLNASGTANPNNVVQDITGTGQLWGMPAYWNGSIYYWGSTLYSSSAAALNSMLQFSLSSGKLSSSPQYVGTYAETGDSNFTGATPSISANGATNGIVWVVDQVNGLGSAAQYFYAYSAADVATTLWSSTTNAARDGAGAAGHWVVPTIADGKAFIVSSNQIQVYGLFSFTVAASASAVSVDNGGSTSTTLNLTGTSGFAGGVTLSASGLPNGVTVTFSPGSNGSQIATFAASGATATGTTPAAVTITGNFNGYTYQVPIKLTVGGFADFAIASVTPASVSVAPAGSSVTSTVSINNLGGFNATPSFTVSGLPSGVTGTFSGYLFTLSAASGTPSGAYPLTITGTSGSLSHSASFLLTVSSTSGVLAVNLSGAYNAYAIFNDGDPVTNGGVDGTSYAYSGNFLGSSLSWGSVPFSLGQPGTPSAVRNETVSLPAGASGYLNLLAACSYGPLTNQTFTVTYSDKSTSTYTQSLSDWNNAQFYSGESIIDAVANRITPTGAVQSGPWYVFGYTIPLTSGKTAASVTLPATNDIFVLAITLSPTTPTPLLPFTITPGAPSFTLAPNTGGTLPVSITDTPGFTGTPTLSLSGLPATASYAFTNVSASGATLVIFAQQSTAPGTYPLTIIGTDGNAIQTAALSFVISGSTTPQAQTITFNAIPAQILGGTLTVRATASSGLPVSFSVVPNGNCSVSGNVVTFLNTGNCGVLANQAGNGTYAAAPQVGQIIVVNNPQVQTITFAAPANQAAGTTEALSAAASSGLTVTFASSTASVCTVSGATASLIAAGTCTIVASQAGNNVYGPATPVTRSLTVTGTVSITATVAPATLAQGNYNAFTASISGESSAPANLGLGSVPCVNIGGCTVPLSGSSAPLNFEFFNVTNTGASLGVYVNPLVTPGTYAIPITIGTAQVGTFTLTVPSTVNVTLASVSLAPGNYNTFTASISGESTAPTTLGLGDVPCVNIAGCTVTLSGSSTPLNFEFFSVTNTSATLGIYVNNNPSVTAGTYSIPITIGSTIVGTLKLTVP